MPKLRSILISLLMSGSLCIAPSTRGELFSQPIIEWQKCLGGSGYDEMDALTQLPGGGYIMLGWTTSDDGDVFGLHGYNADYWLVRLNESGGKIWQQPLGGLGYDKGTCVAVCSDGGYVVAGNSTSDDNYVSGHHGTGQFTDYWVARTDSSGNILWQNSYGGTHDDGAKSIIQLSDGGYIAAGYSYSEDGDVTGHHDTYAVADYWIIRLDASGTLLWQKSLGGSSDEFASTIIPTADGNFIVSGSSGSSDGDVNGHHGNSWIPATDYWIVKLELSGNILWNNSFGSNGTDNTGNIQQTADGGLILSGTTFSNDGDVSGNHGASDYWIVKLDSAGLLQWQKCLGGSDYDIGRSVIQPTSGGYVTCGYSYSNNGDVTGNHGDYDYWIAGMSSSGGLLWQKSLGGSGEDDAFDIIECRDGGYTVAGLTRSANNGDVYGMHGYVDAWIVKLGSMVVGIQNDPVENAAAENIILYPNPVIDEAYMELFSEKNQSVSIEILDLAGRRVEMYSVNATEGKNKLVIPLRDSPAGIYFLRILFGSHSKLCKFVKT